MVLETRRRGFTDIRVGLPKTLEQSINDMCHSDFFVGIDSGMAHVARSVGIPVFLYRGKLDTDWIYKWHPEGSVTLFDTIPELFDKLTAAGIMSV